MLRTLSLIKPGTALLLMLFPGTLNVQLAEEYSIPANATRLEGEEYGGTVSINIVPCRIFEEGAVILRTDANESGEGLHPKRHGSDRS
jgi:riboflavin kinase, archaea type